MMHVCEGWQHAVQAIEGIVARRVRVDCAKSQITETLERALGPECDG
jgi:hypothetical protein